MTSKEYPPLYLTENEVRDALGAITVDDLANPQPRPEPEMPVHLENATPLVARLWQVALADVEKNIIVAETGRYLGGGAFFGPMVYTRDISYSGILGLNRIYPRLMMDSMKFTREVRLRLGFRVSRGYAVREIPAPWQEEDLGHEEYSKKYNTNPYTRRTDDVVWLWCAADLLARHGTVEDWQWMYDKGQIFFRDFYAPFFDASDGLFFGQASFIDIHFEGSKKSGYPQEWSMGDCVRVKATSTNCLYVLGMNAMAQAAERLGLADDAREWKRRVEDLKHAIRSELRHADGTFTYFKDKNGVLEKRREALGTALVVLADVVDGKDAARALAGYPITDAGVPLFHPFFPWDSFYHNNSSWPFVDTFMLMALEKNDGQDRSARNAALLARTCVDDGTFHEVVDFRSKQPKGSASQLWTAAAFIGACFRARVAIQ